VITTIVLLVLGLISIVIPALIAWKSDKAQVIGFYVLVVLDALCVKYFFPLLPSVTSEVALEQAFAVAAISATLIGVFGLASLRLFVFLMLSASNIWAWKTESLAENIYITFGPLINAFLLIFWTLFIPSLGFTEICPGALLAGLVLHFLDIGVVRKWTKYFQLNKQSAL
jgi:hypothetical protein